MHINDVIAIRENQQQILDLEKKWSGFQCSKAGRMLVRQASQAGTVEHTRKLEKLSMPIKYS